MLFNRSSRILQTLLIGVLFCNSVIAQEKPPAQNDPGKVEAEWTQALRWRSIGPATMGGRIVDLAVYEKNPSTWWVATASGGLLKTTNNGITFDHQFDREATVSIGSVAVAQSNPDIVYVGTGENNPRNSVSYGDGVYKSTDGGKTWQNVGLKKTFQIGRIKVHPTNPDIVYVGALGRLYGRNKERGLFKTTDGGKTWKKIWYLDDKTGVIDLQMNPENPEELLFASWERLRDGYDFNDPAIKWGEGAGLYKTSDGGKTFKKLTEGLPTCKLGRIGIDYYRKNPKTIFVIVDSEEIGKGPPQVARSNAYMGILGENDPKGARLTRVTPNGPTENAGLQVGDIITAVDKKVVKTYQDLIAQIQAHKGGDKVVLTYLRDGKPMMGNLTYGTRPGRPGGGGVRGRPLMTRLGGQTANRQDRQGKEGFQYGGVYKSTDGGETWKRINSINPRPMYFSQIRVSPTDEKTIWVLGISLYRSFDGGKTFRPDGGRGTHADHHAMWIDPNNDRHVILGNDGGVYVTYDEGKVWDHLNTKAIGQFYHVGIDTRKNYWVYGGLQDNGSWGGPSFTRGRSGAVNEDWIRVGGGDGFRCLVDPNDHNQIYYTSQNGAMSRRNLRTNRTGSIRSQLPRAPGGARHQWNWNTPFLLSHHNSKIFYCAGSFVLKSLNQGTRLEVISPKITHSPRGSATALSESPLNPKVLYVGTDDGALWVTVDGGQNWTDITQKVRLKGARWVSSIEASRFHEGTAYVVFDGHRSDDDNPLVYVTNDHGKTWKSLNAGLPWGSTRVLREDVVNRDLLYLGTEFGIWFSLNRGQTWNKLNNNLPTVAVHEIAVHPTAGEIVAATHGRSLWILDVSALRQFSFDTLKTQNVFYKPQEVIRWQSEPSRGGTNRQFRGENPPGGAVLYYSLKEKAERVRITFLDTNGNRLASISGGNEKGLNRVTWNLVARGGGGRRPGRQRPPAITTGEIRAVLNVDGVELTQTLKLVADPTVPADVRAEQAKEDTEKRLESDEDDEEEEQDDVVIDD